MGIAQLARRRWRGRREQRLAPSPTLVGRLEKVLDDRAISYPGYHLYYASRRASPVVSLMVGPLRHSGAV